MVERKMSSARIKDPLSRQLSKESVTTSGPRLDRFGGEPVDHSHGAGPVGKNGKLIKITSTSCGFCGEEW
jgi:hypothetical protein